jgi:hypothetical protein
MAENLPRLNIKSRHGDKPCNKAEVIRLNSILKTWLQNNALAKEDRTDKKSMKRSFFILGTKAEAIPASQSTLQDEDQITLP